MPILHSFEENKLKYADENEVEIKMMGTRMDKESLEQNLYENDITLSICHNFSPTSNPPIKPKDLGTKVYLLGDKQIPSVGVFDEKPDKIANWHNEGLKNFSQKVETASGFPAKPSRFASDGVRTLATTSERSRPKETLEDSSSQDKEDYSTCARSIIYCFDHNSFIRTEILTL
ncbi:hypothetical protein Tco_0455740 [Tanacetum coccineum]